MQENPVDLIYAGKLYEVQDYINRTQHVYSFFHWLMNEDFYQGLSDEDRDMLLSAIDEATRGATSLSPKARKRCTRS